MDFTNDINPLLTRLGCNGGSCHGKSNGRGGFLLEPVRASSRVGLRVDHTGRPRPGGSSRQLRASPPLLRKPTMQMPHGGGRRMSVDSDAYRLVSRWVREGAGWGEVDVARLQRIEVFPGEATVRSGHSQQFVVTAVYDDGTRRDVRGWLNCEPTIRAWSRSTGPDWHSGKRTGQTPVIALLQGRSRYRG
ncbi:MAG: hypothetical protein CM1200mP2_02830 [Planctomycetaceae bacterium]|nr:MAG: hypothetical protein CM1200mP2_02830 [Planctomycetaceae bacterium]